MSAYVGWWVGGDSGIFPSELRYVRDNAKLGDKGNLLVCWLRGLPYWGVQAMNGI